MYTKDNIFPLYAGKCKVRHTKKYTDDYGKPFPITCDYEFQAFYPKNDKTNEKVIAGHKGQTARINISDCTLLLKPLSKMSGEKVGKLRAFMGLSVVNCTIDDLYEFLTEGKRIVLNLIQINKLYSWLINHGYAISDELFELNIAEETNA